MNRSGFILPPGFRAFAGDLAKGIALTAAIATWAVLFAAVFA